MTPLTFTKRHSVILRKTIHQEATRVDKQ